MIIMLLSFTKFTVFRKRGEILVKKRIGRFKKKDVRALFVVTYNTTKLSFTPT